MVKACSYELTPKGVYRVKLLDNVYDTVGGITGSYNVLLSRLLGLTYADFFRYLIKNYDVEVKGRNSKYLSFVFKNEKDVKNFCSVINSRWSCIFK